MPIVEAVATIPNREILPLAGKVFVLTGASRGIGAAVALELARKGATIIAPHRDPGKNSRAAEVVGQVEELGGRMVAPVADMTQKEDRARLLEEIKQNYGQVDGIIFNHAGGMEKDLMAADPQYHLKVNGHSKGNFLKEAIAAGILNNHAVVIDVPSMWSTFQHTEIDQLPDYAPVAKGKKLGEQLLREITRTHQIKFGSVCGHAIGDTTTVKLLSRMNREAMTAVEQTAEGGKLPTIADMAQAISTMAEGNFEDEEIVFVGPPQIRREDMAQTLPMYDESTRYVDQLVRFDPTRSFGYYRVRAKDTEPNFALGDGLNILDITDEDTKGHFIPETGISVLPGHKIVAAAAAVASQHLPESSRLAGIEGVEFKIPVLPGDILLMDIGDAGISNVSAMIGEVEVATVDGLHFEPVPEERPTHMSEDRLIEAAAQTLGLAYLHSKNIRDVLPLFGGVSGPIEYYKDVKPGDKLEMEAVLTKGTDAKQFSGDVTIRVDEELVAKIRGIDCRLFPARGLGRIIGLGRSKLR